MVFKTKYELMTELKTLLKANNTNVCVTKMNKKEVEHEIIVQKEMLVRSYKIRSEKGRPEPRKIEMIENQDGFKVAVKPEKRMIRAPPGGKRGRPRKDEVIYEPPTLPATRLETLGADSDDDSNEEEKIVHVPPITATRCTCLTCPVHNSTKRI